MTDYLSHGLWQGGLATESEETPVRRHELPGVDRVEELARQLAAAHEVAGERGWDARFVERVERSVRFLEGLTPADEQPLARESEWWRECRAALGDQATRIREQLASPVSRKLPRLRDGEPRAYAVATEFLERTDGVFESGLLRQFLAAYQSRKPLTIRELWAVPLMLRLGLLERLRLATRREDAADVLDNLQRLDEADWPECFERTSRVEATLRHDPAGIYGATDFETRDRCRHVVEELARRSGLPELSVARLAIEQAEAAAAQGTTDFRQWHVGYYLLDRGREHLETILYARPMLRERLVRFVERHATGLYLSAIGMGTALGVAGLTWLAAASGGAIAVCLLAASLVLLPVSEIVVQLVNFLITRWFPPRKLPKLEFKHGLPSTCATIVVMPAMLLNEREVAALLERLESHYLANREPNLYFALLTDFRDADAPHTPGDDALLAQAVEGVRQLNERVIRVATDDGTETTTDRPVRATPFLLFHRPRTWNPVEKTWMGWERKRGKLLEFNRLLLETGDTSFRLLAGTPPRLSELKYVITLDADTQLPHGAARRLVGTIAHPLNRPQISSGPNGRRIATGYAIVQPRVAVSLSSSNHSWYARIFGGGAGLDPYVAAVSDVYQDLFGEGNFVGKGIYDVAAFQAAVDGVFPENRVLSHDLIEGCHARVGLATDIALVDGFPARYDADARRQHRWARGDWQVLPWLLGRVPTERGWRTNPLAAISRWKIFDNLRRSLVPAATLLLFVAGWTVLPGSAATWTLVAVAATTMPLLLEVWRTLVNPQLGRLLLPNPVRRKPPNGQEHPCYGVRDYLREAGHRLELAAARAILTVAFLPHQAYSLCDAVVRSQTRLWCTRRRLLEWECAAETERRLDGRRDTLLRDMWFPPALVVALLLLAMFMPSFALGAATPLLLLWFASPALAHLISYYQPGRPPVLSGAQAESLDGFARQTWRFFQTHVGPASNWLPPDSVQEQPPSIAERISPTNEGLYLLSALAAHDLGYLGERELAEQLEANLRTWQQLPRYRGHNLNWYDTRTLGPLTPRYVSAVDSGNLAACLITLGHGLRELAASPHGTQRDRWPPLIAICERLVAEMDFGFLFDSQRGLFHIGYSLETETLDRAHYDLLASESRLTSLVAIAKGDVDSRHWRHLDRRLTHVARSTCLVSWNGSLFEYLMPCLFHGLVPGSLLDQSCRAAVARQIEYGRERGVPWGISESAFARLNDKAEYDYRGFGVPGLGRKRDLDRDLVVSPYSTMLALLVDPDNAVKNLSELVRAGALGTCGFLDAIDFTRERLPPGQTSVVVPCYLAHHQGMSLLAMAACLRPDRMWRRFRAEPAIRTAELLLQEKSA